MVVLKEQICKFLLWEGLVVLKEIICKFLLWEGVLVLKELTFNISTCRRCGGLERTDF